MKRYILCSLLFLFAASNIYSQWEEMNNTTFWRHHAIGFSFNDFGYVLSGGNIFGTTTMYRYDPASDDWEQLPSYAGPARSYGMGAQVNGKGYFGFGRDDSNGTLLNDLWEFDPTTLTYNELPDCPCDPRFHPAFVAHNEKIYAGMGDDPDGDLNDWWEYDIETQEWEQKTSIPGIRHHPFFFSIGEFVYVGGGHDANWYRYDPSNDSWAPIEPLDDRVAGTQFSYNGKGYVLSGTNNTHQNLATGEFWEYDPVEDTWTQLAPHPDGAKWAPTSFIIDGYIYIVTGMAEESDYTVYRYNLDEATTVENIDQLDGLNVFPNPFSNTLQVRSNDIIRSDFTEVKVTGVTGNLVYQSHISNSYELDLDFLPRGSYVLSLVSGERTFAKLIVKN